MSRLCHFLSALNVTIMTLFGMGEMSRLWHFLCGLNVTIMTLFGMG